MQFVLALEENEVAVINASVHEETEAVNTCPRIRTAALEETSVTVICTLSANPHSRPMFAALLPLSTAILMPIPKRFPPSSTKAAFCHRSVSGQAVQGVGGFKLFPVLLHCASPPSVGPFYKGSFV
jgi:hypothetical protein